MLTLDPAQRAGRALAAAQAKAQAGAFDVALDLLAMAEAGPLTEFQRARADLLGPRSRSSPAGAATRRPAAEGGQAAGAHRRRAFPGHLPRRPVGRDVRRPPGRPGRRRAEIARTAAAAPGRRRSAACTDLLLDGLAAHYTEGYAAGVPILRRALAAFDDGLSVDEELRWLWLGCIAAVHVWDDERWEELAEPLYPDRPRPRRAQRASPCAQHPRSHARVRRRTGRRCGTDRGAAGGRRKRPAAASRPMGRLGLAAFRGDEAEASALIEATREEATARGRRHRGHRRPMGKRSAEQRPRPLPAGDDRGRAGQRARPGAGLADWALVELIEAAARSG